MRERPIRYRVWARVAWAVLDGAERGGIDPRPLVEGLPFDRDSVRRLGQIDWEHYVEIVERLYAAFPDGGAFERFVEETYHRVFPETSTIARALLSPKTLIWAIVTLADPILFPPIAFNYQDRGDDRVRLELTLRKGARPSLAFFRGNVGGYRGATRHLGLPPAEVQADVSAEHATLDLRLPRSQTLAARARACSGGFSLVLGAPNGRSVSATFGESEEADATRLDLIEAARRRYHLTSRQVDVLECLIRGMANKEIADSLGCAVGTIEAHMTRLLRSFGVDSRGQLLSRLLAGP